MSVVKSISGMKSLSARLLIFTIVIIMLSEVLIFVPSISRFRKVWFEEHIASAELAALATAAAMGEELSQELQDRLLNHAGAHGIALVRDGRKIMALSMDMPQSVDEVVMMSNEMPVHLIWQAFTTLAQNQNRVLRVLGRSALNPDTMVEVILDESPLRIAMYHYSERILALSIVVSLITAAFVYLSLQWLMVRPMGRITRSMIQFRQDPESDANIIEPSRSDDEIGMAQRALEVMQRDLRRALREKTRLAALGSAVAKINHDLRNTLATATLISDRLAKSEDPDVREISPRLIEAIDRAVTLCSHTLHFVGDSTLHLMKERLYLSDIVEEAQAALRPVHLPLEANDGSTWANGVPQMLEVEVDGQQLVRVIVNLARNALQAGANTLTFTCREEEGRIHLFLSDNGPGMPRQAVDNLFVPFEGSARKGGTGLGMIIARDIMTAHDGDLILVSTGESGTTFELILPMPNEDDDLSEDQVEKGSL